MVDSMVNMLEITLALLRHCLHDHGVPWEFKLEQSRETCSSRALRSGADADAATLCCKC